MVAFPGVTFPGVPKWTPPALPNMTAHMDKISVQAQFAQGQADDFGGSAPPLPGPWRDSREFVMAMMALLFVILFIRLIVKRCAKSNPKFDKVLTNLEGDLAAGYPWITAVLALLVVTANAVLLAGLLRTLDSFGIVGKHVARGAARVNGTVVLFEQRVFLANETFFNFSRQADEALAAMRKVSRATAAELFEVAVPNAAGAHARRIIEENGEQAVATLLATSDAGKMITAQLQSFGGQQLPFQSLTEDINSLSYMVDQVSSAVDILQTVNEMRSRRCAHTNCSRVVRKSTPDIEMKFVEMLGSARDSVGALASVYDGSPNITLRKLLVLLPSDVRLRIAGLGELHGAGADATQQVVDELKLSNASQLFSSPLYMMFEDLDSRAALLQSTLNDQVAPLLKSTFAEVIGMTRQAKALLLMLATTAPRLGSDVGVALRLPAILCAGYGIVVSIFVFFYAISMRWNESRWCCLRIVNYIFETVGYFTLYLLIDLFVLFSFFFFFAVLLICVVDAGLVASCAGIKHHGPITAPVCAEISSVLGPAVVMAAAGGIMNFLLSYHLIAALQATYSQYVATAAPQVVVVTSKKQAAAVEKVIAGGAAEDVLSSKIGRKSVV